MPKGPVPDMRECLEALRRYEAKLRAEMSDYRARKETAEELHELPWPPPTFDDNPRDHRTITGMVERARADLGRLRTVGLDWVSGVAPSIGPQGTFYRPADLGERDIAEVRLSGAVEVHGWRSDGFSYRSVGPGSASGTFVAGVVPRGAIGFDPPISEVGPDPKGAVDFNAGPAPTAQARDSVP